MGRSVIGPLVILIGGFLQSVYDFSDKTLMYDFSENFDAIRNGPTLLHKRDLHACGTFEYNGKTIEKKSLEGETGISTQWESGIRTLIVLYESPDSAFPLFIYLKYGLSQEYFLGFSSLKLRCGDAIFNCSA